MHLLQSNSNPAFTPIFSPSLASLPFPSLLLLLSSPCFLPSLPPLPLSPTPSNFPSPSPLLFPPFCSDSCLPLSFPSAPSHFLHRHSFPSPSLLFAPAPSHVVSFISTPSSSLSLVSTPSSFPSPIPPTSHTLPPHLLPYSPSFPRPPLLFPLLSLSPLLSFASTHSPSLCLRSLSLHLLPSSSLHPPSLPFTPVAYPLSLHPPSLSLALRPSPPILLPLFSPVIPFIPPTLALSSHSCTRSRTRTYISLLFLFWPLPPLLHRLSLKLPPFTPAPPFTSLSHWLCHSLRSRPFLLAPPPFFAPALSLWLCPSPTHVPVTWPSDPSLPPPSSFPDFLPLLLHPSCSFYLTFSHTVVVASTLSSSPLVPLPSSLPFTPPHFSLPFTPPPYPFCSHSRSPSLLLTLSPLSLPPLTLPSSSSHTLSFSVPVVFTPSTLPLPPYRSPSFYPSPSIPLFCSHSFYLPLSPFTLLRFPPFRSCPPLPLLLHSLLPYFSILCYLSPFSLPPFTLHPSPSPSTSPPFPLLL